MRKLIAAMKTSIDGKITGPEGVADWVAGWSDDYGITDRVDACVLGAGMYPGYEMYWTPIQDDPTGRHPMTGTLPTPGEVAWAEYAATTPHYVLSHTLDSAKWPLTRFLRSTGELEELKRRPGKDIYLMGGARVTADLIDRGLVDELHLIVYPLVAGPGAPLFSGKESRLGLELRSAEVLGEGRVHLIYSLGGAKSAADVS